MFVMMLCSGSHVCFVSLVKSFSVSFRRYCPFCVCYVCRNLSLLNVVPLNLFFYLFLCSCLTLKLRNVYNVS